MKNEQILAHIRNVPDFPKKGIIFKDITTALKNPDVLQAVINNLCAAVKDVDFDYVAVIESRGFLLGAPLAYQMHKGLVLVRKKGKLPAKVIRENCTLEYGTTVLEMHEDAIEKGKKVLIIDDVLATGGTVNAVCRLIDKVGGITVGALFLMELTALAKNVQFNFPIYSLIKC